MKPFTTVAILFLRFLLGWEVIVNGVSIPTWASGIACVVAGWLAIMSWRESRR